jgi:hypothetical protein
VTHRSASVDPDDLADDPQGAGLEIDISARQGQCLAEPGV